MVSRNFFLHALLLTSLVLGAGQLSGCSRRVGNDWRWTDPKAQIAITEDVYRAEASCRALSDLSKKHPPCSSNGFRTSNKRLLSGCETYGPFGTVNQRISLYPVRSSSNGLSDLESGSEIDVNRAIGSITDKVGMNYVLDSTKPRRLSGTFVDVAWNDAFLNLVQGSDLEYAASCNAIVIGEPSAISTRALTNGAEVRGTTVTNFDCNRSFYGKKVDLKFDRTPLDKVFARLSSISNLNFVLEPDVSGRVSARLRNVAWDEALTLILQTFNLDKLQSGNVVRIGTVESIKAERSALRKTSGAKCPATKPVSGKKSCASCPSKSKSCGKGSCTAKKKGVSTRSKSVAKKKKK